ncbi:MAG: hypothetical protein HY554_11740 [Elusimicrobia bacterium]|nr:hypothetical protein [Elusimicrobiota bacterium]
MGIAVGVLMAVMMGAMMLGGHLFGRKAHKHERPPETAVCPVSGNRITISSNTVQGTVRGQRYYFDNEEHLREFVLDPDKFLRAPGNKDLGGD